MLIKANYSWKFYKVCQVNQVNKFNRYKFGGRIGCALQKAQKEIQILFKIHSFTFFPKIFFHCLFNNVTTDFENEFVICLLIICNLIVPNFSEYMRTYEKVGVHLLLQKLFLKLRVDLISDNSWCILNNFKWFILGTTIS